MFDMFVAMGVRILLPCPAFRFVVQNTVYLKGKGMHILLLLLDAIKLHTNNNFPFD